MNRVGQNSRRNVQCKYDHMSINQVITDVLNEYRRKYHGLSLDKLIVNISPKYFDANNIIINNVSYITCQSIEIYLVYNIKLESHELIKEEDLNAFYREHSKLCTTITCSNIWFSRKNVSYKALSNNIITKEIWYDFELTPSECKGNKYYKCRQTSFVRRLLEPTIDFIYIFYNNAIRNNVEPSTLINLLDETIPVKIVKSVPKINIEDKLNMVSDALEKDEMKKIIDLHKVIKTTNFNAPLIAIMKDYLGNVSENVQLHLQTEIREIIEVMTGEKYDLNAYIHNL